MGTRTTMPARLNEQLCNQTAVRLTRVDEGPAAITEGRCPAAGVTSGH